ncbi:MAG: ABC transporter substrate-binding protein [Parachlamydiaceae bacterium]|nr:ABC transporter substrate-binding protein [Parachlamydiaceae bacterium]
MKKESLTLYFLRLILILGVFALMGMLYWSSLLIEENLKEIEFDLKQIKHELVEVKGTLNKTELNYQKSPNIHESKNEIALIETSSENLLSPDPFYLHTLPKQLGPHFTPHGIRKNNTMGKPDHLNPFTGWYEAASWNRMCIPSLVTQEIGKYETYCPEAAISMELKYNDEGYPEYWLKLREDLFWEPLNPRHFSDNIELAPWFLQRHQVTAHDFKFYFDAVKNPHVEELLAVTLRNSHFNDIEEVRVIDDFNLVVKWKTKEAVDANGKVIHQMKYTAKSITGSISPLPRFVYQYFADGSKIVEDDDQPNTYRINSVWAQNFSHHWAQNVIVCCGAWLFDGMNDREVKFKRNPHYFNPLATLVESYEIKFKDSPDSIWNDFKLGNIDLTSIRPNQLNELQEFLQSAPYQQQIQQNPGLEIQRLSFLSRSFSYIAWNELRPQFQSKKVRQALTMAIDRQRIIRQNLNGMGLEITGPNSPYSTAYDKNIKPYPHDIDLARQYLHEEGWIDRRGSGVLEKQIDGKWIPFQFTLNYYVKDTTFKSICEFVATSLRELGIECNLSGIDVADLSALFDNKDFDALCMTWSLDTPPEDPKQLWYSSSAAEKGSSNFISFSNHEVDTLCDQLEYEEDPQKRIEIYHRIQQIIHNEAPYVFLFAPKATVAYRSYLQNVLIPADNQDLFPGGNVDSLQSNIFWIKED